MSNTYSVEELQFMFNEGFSKAERACDAYLAQYGDRDSCGFAWVIIEQFNGKKIDGRQKIAKTLKSLDGVRKGYDGITVWNPAKSPTQSISALEAGARAFAVHLNQYGFKSYMNSRVD